MIHAAPATNGVALSERAVATADLPAAYEAAVAALERCASVDECKTWADKAAALASYGRQSEDERLTRHAMRIQARATRRCGELLEAFKTSALGGRPKETGGGVPPVSQRATAKRFHISRDREKLASRAANIPAAEFNAVVESDNPPTLKQLSEMGKRPAPPQPEGFYQATHLMGALRRLAEKCEPHSPAFIVGGIKAHEISEARQQTQAVIEWLTEFDRRLRERKST